MKENRFDLIVIGSGSGGLGAALGMLKMGFKVLMIDKSADKIGGECLNTGCVPSKAFLHAANSIYQSRYVDQFGLKVEGKVSIEKVLKYVKQRQNEIRAHENVDYLKKLGLDIVLGRAVFHSKNSVEVDRKVYSAKNIVIATGSAPRKLKVKGIENSRTYTNESIFDIDFLPENFLFVGAGPVSIELGQAFSRLGSKVTIIDRGKRILKKEDPYIVEVLQKQLENEKIQFYFETEIEEIKANNRVILKSKGTELETISTDAIFMGIGRVLNFEDLQLNKAAIKTKKGKIVLNSKLQTTNKNVYVCGDAADNLKFSHAAEMHNMLLINNFLSPIKKKLDFEHFPWVTFTNPEIASFGLNEKQLKEKNMDYERLETDFSELDRAITDNYQYGRLLLFIEKKSISVGSAKILGGSMVAPHAGEMAQELFLANTAGIPIKKLVNKIYPYPTATNINKLLIRNRMLEDLKPWMKKLVQFYYKF